MKRVKLFLKVLVFSLLIVPIAFVLSACGEDAQSGSGSNQNNGNNAGNGVNASSIAVSAQASAQASDSAVPSETASATASVAPSDQAPASAGPQNLTGITFNNDTCTYDGAEHELLINGVLPQGAVVEYSNNKGTNAGDYNASVTITCDGYNPLVLNALLRINKANYDMSGAQWNYNANVGYTYNGSAQSVEVIGLPDGVTVASYQNNSNTNAGNFYALSRTVIGKTCQSIINPLSAGHVEISLINSPIQVS